MSLRHSLLGIAPRLERSLKHLSEPTRLQMSILDVTRIAVGVRQAKISKTLATADLPACGKGYDVVDRCRSLVVRVSNRGIKRPFADTADGTVTGQQSAHDCGAFLTVETTKAPHRCL